jgi:hypothetical protein
MMNDKPYSLDERAPLRVLIIPPMIAEAAPTIARIMQEHGGSVETLQNGNVRLMFPAGTTSQEILPRVTETRSNVLFPDGYQIRWVQLRDGTNTLRFPSEDFPPDVQETLRHLL